MEDKYHDRNVSFRCQLQAARRWHEPSAWYAHRVVVTLCKSTALVKGSQCLAAARLYVRLKEPKQREAAVSLDTQHKSPRMVT